MSPEYALSIWRSVKTTFVLFLVVVPIVVLANISETGVAENTWRDLLAPAAALVIFAGIIAEICRRMINFFAGGAICNWAKTQ